MVLRLEKPIANTIDKGLCIDFVAEIPGRSYSLNCLKSSWQRTPEYKEFIENNFIRGRVHSNMGLLFVDDILEKANQPYYRQNPAGSPEGATPLTALPAGTRIWIQFSHSCERLHDVEWVRSVKNAKQNNLGFGSYVSTKRDLLQEALVAAPFNCTPAEALDLANQLGYCEGGSSPFTLGETTAFPAFDAYNVKIDSTFPTGFEKADGTAIDTDLLLEKIFGVGGLCPDPIRQKFPKTNNIAYSANTTTGPVGKSGSIESVLGRIGSADDGLTVIVPKAAAPAGSYLIFKTLDVATNTGGA